MPGPDQNPLSLFTTRAADYARARPGYPAEAIDATLAGLADPATLIAADIGAGTGISARLLADRAVRVFAIEPNAAMRDAAEPHPRVEFREGQAERTGLADASMDVVLCAQAFHWFRADEALAEFARILRPGARLALLWNDPDTTDAATASYYDPVLAASTDRSICRPHDDPHAFWKSPLFRARRTLAFSYTHALTLDTLLARAFSASYIPQSGPGADALAQRLREAHARHADRQGRFAMRYLTRLFLAER